MKSNPEMHCIHYYGRHDVLDSNGRLLIKQVYRWNL